MQKQRSKNEQRQLFNDVSVKLKSSESQTKKLSVNVILMALWSHRLNDLMTNNKMTRKSLSHLEERYRLINLERGRCYWLCVYCGQPADTRDHYPPISRVYDYESIGLKHEIYIKVPSCRVCNSLASDFLDDNFLDRVERVKDSIRKKYSKHFKNFEWDETELEEREIGRNLRTKILEGSKKQKIYSSMIEYYKGVDMLIKKIDVGGK